MRARTAILAIVAASTAVVASTASAQGTSLDALLAPALAAWIESSREAALERGVDEIPDEIREAMTGYVPDAILDVVRWRVDDGTVSVQWNLFRMGYTNAVTFDHVIVFEAARDVADPELWAHELVHVMQYRDWGVDGFAARYVADYEAVERDAARFRWQWARAAGRVPLPAEREQAPD